MTQYGFHFDGKRCTGCKTCVLACKDNKDLSADMSFRNVYEYGGGSWTQVDGLWEHRCVHLLRIRRVQSLRQPVVPGELLAGSYLQGRRHGHRGRWIPRSATDAAHASLHVRTVRQR